MSISDISVTELKSLRDSKADFLILDVRNPDEYAICNLNGYLIPFNELPARMTELNPNQLTVVHCHGGGRSSRATAFLIDRGFKKVCNLRGGITAWANEIDTSMPTY